MTRYALCLLGQKMRSKVPYYLRSRLPESLNSSVSFTTISSLDDKLKNPGKLVSGLTTAEIEANPEISDFLNSNFGHEEAGAKEVTSGIHIPAEILKEFGIEDEDVAVPNKNYGDHHVDAGLGNAEEEYLNIRVLKTYVRSEDGSNSSRRLRNNNMIPGILFGSDPTKKILSTDFSSKVLLKTPWPELQRELDRYHRQFESRVYDLTILEDENDEEGTVHRVVPSSVQRHPVQGSIYCANFLRYHPGRPLKIPLKYINKEESPALKRDGYIIPVNKYVKCLVEDGVPIPDALEVECTGLQVKDVIRTDRLIFPDGVRPIDSLDLTTFVIGPVRGGKGAATSDDSNDDSEAEEE